MPKVSRGRGGAPFVEAFAGRVLAAAKEQSKPARPWQEFVPDPLLQRYYAAEVFGRPSSLRLAAELDEARHGSMSTVDISEFLAFRPFLLLGLTQSPYPAPDDPEAPRVVERATVRALLIWSLVAVSSANLAKDGQRGAIPTRAFRIAYGARSCSPMTSAGWQHVFGATEQELKVQFRNERPDIQELDEGERRWRFTLDYWRAHGRWPTWDEVEAAGFDLRPAADVPVAFLNWAWANHRRVTFEDFAPFGLTRLHWEVLTRGDE